MADGTSVRRHLGIVAIHDYMDGRMFLPLQKALDKVCYSRKQFSTLNCKTAFYVAARCDFLSLSVLPVFLGQ